MVYRGHVENGMIRLEDAPALREGLEVEVRLLTEDASAEGEEEIPSLEADPSRFYSLGSRSTPGARRGVQSNGTTAIIICPCGKVNHPARISKLVMKIL